MDGIMDATTAEEGERLSASGMWDMVDVVVAKLKETPKWQYIPDRAADRIIAELKSLYTGSFSSHLFPVSSNFSYGAHWTPARRKS